VARRLTRQALHNTLRAAPGRCPGSAAPPARPCPTWATATVGPGPPLVSPANRGVQFNVPAFSEAVPGTAGGKRSDHSDCGKQGRECGGGRGHHRAPARAETWRIPRPGLTDGKEGFRIKGPRVSPVAAGTGRRTVRSWCHVNPGPSCRPLWGSANRRPPNLRCRSHTPELALGTTLQTHPVPTGRKVISVKVCHPGTARRGGPSGA